MTNSLELLAGLLEDHDGDDRCGCLAESVWVLADPDTQREQALSQVVARLSGCLAEHQAGATLRKRFAQSID